MVSEEFVFLGEIHSRQHIRYANHCLPGTLRITMYEVAGPALCAVTRKYFCNNLSHVLPAFDVTRSLSVSAIQGRV